MRHNHAPLLGIHKIYLHLVKLPDQFRRQRIPRVAQRRDAAVMQRRPPPVSDAEQKLRDLKIDNQ